MMNNTFIRNITDPFEGIVDSYVENNTTVSGHIKRLREVQKIIKMGRVY